MNCREDNRIAVEKNLIKYKVRSSHPKVFFKGAFRNFAKFTGKHPCESLVFDKVADLRPVNFPVNFAKFLIVRALTKNTFFIEHLW